MTLYQKVLAAFGVMRDLIRGKADNTELAPPFNPVKEYAVGECTMYNNVLYKCTTEHYGEWDARHFERTTATSSIPHSTSQLTNDSNFTSGNNVQPATKCKISYDKDGLVTAGSDLAQSDIPSLPSSKISDFNTSVRNVLRGRFLNMELPNDATQYEVRVMVQSILAALKDVTACIAVFLCAFAYGGTNRLDDNTTWDKVYPTNKVKYVVSRFAPEPDLSPSNSVLAQTIHELSSPPGFGVNENGEFWISYSKTNSMDNAQIHYSKGTLYLNANQVVTKGGVIGGGGGDTNQYDFACFVSSENGSDRNDGKTAAAPFRTLDRAIEVATNGVVCVMSGTYEYPAFYGKSDVLTYGVDFIAVAGPDSTFIATTNSLNPGIIHSLGYLSFFKGFTFKNLTHSKGVGFVSHGYYRAAVEYSFFENCRFTDIDTEMLGEWEYPMFYYCVMDNCSLDAKISYPDSGSHEDTGSGATAKNYDRIFFSCAFLDCDLTIRTGGSYPSFGDSNYMRNCIVRSETLYRAGRFHGGVNSWGPPIETSRINDSTFIVAHSVASDRVQFVGTGSIVGIGTNSVPDPATVNITYGVYTNATTVSEAIGPDFRIRSPARWFFMGYDSKSDRELFEIYKTVIKEDLGL